MENIEIKLMSEEDLDEISETLEESLRKQELAQEQE